jgi:hypothetical protein
MALSRVLDAQKPKPTCMMFSGDSWVSPAAGMAGVTMFAPFVSPHIVEKESYLIGAGSLQSLRATGQSHRSPSLVDPAGFVHRRRLDPGVPAREWTMVFQTDASNCRW